MNQDHDTETHLHTCATCDPEHRREAVAQVECPHPDYQDTLTVGLCAFCLRAHRRGEFTEIEFAAMAVNHIETCMMAELSREQENNERTNR